MREVAITEWFTNHRKAMISYGLTNKELAWLDSNEIGISTQYIGLLRLYLNSNTMEELNESSVVQFGGILDSLVMFEEENIGREELHYKALVNALKDWIKNKRDNGY